MPIYFFDSWVGSSQHNTPLPCPYLHHHHPPKRLRFNPLTLKFSTPPDFISPHPYCILNVRNPPTLIIHPQLYLLIYLFLSFRQLNVQN